VTCEGTITYTYTYTNCSGVTAIWQYVYTIQHVTYPIVPTDGGSTVECPASAVLPTYPVVYDVCGNLITPTWTTPDPIACQGTMTYVFTYTDCAGLSSIWNYVYTIQHVTYPVVPSDGGLTVECISSVVTPTPPIVYDVCGTQIQPTMVTPDPITCQGTMTYVFTYTDCAGLSSVWNYVYTIQHSTYPIVPADGGTTVECISSVVTPTPPIVYDVCGVQIQPTMVTPDPITCQGTMTYVFTYTDCAGLSSVWNYVYTIQHVTYPVVPIDGGTTVECISSVVTPTPPIVYDVCGVQIQPTWPMVDPIVCQGTMTYVFTYTDCAGLSSVWNFVYTIQHVTYPVVPTDGGTTVECISNVVTPTPPTVYDVCGIQIQPTMIAPDPITCQGTMTYIFTYTDCAGLSTPWNYVYTIQHSTYPVVPTDGGSVVECISSVVTPTPPTVYDVCGIQIQPTMVTPDPITCQGTMTYVFTYTDCAGLSSVWNYVYTIQHLTSPIVPMNIGLSTVQFLSDAVQPIPPTVVDVCGNVIIPTVSFVDSPNPIVCIGTRVYTFTYTDCAGLTATWTYIYTITELNISLTETDVQCNGEAPGTATVTATCGTEPYT
jgi:hypothetical protein